MKSGIVIRFLSVLLLVFLVGCGEDYGKLVSDAHRETLASMATLDKSLKEGKLRHARVVQAYAVALAEDRPKMAELAAQFGKEGTAEGQAFKSLKERLAKVKLEVDNEKDADQSLEELVRIAAEADPQVFDDSLVDVANVLADLSDGKLPRLNVDKKTAKPKEGAGSYLVGNPRYGHWSSGPSGLYWVWFAGFSPYRSMFFTGSPYYYNSWYGGRPWSYYNDVGRNYYGSRADNQRWSDARRANPTVKPKRSYAPLKSQKRLSTYGNVASRKPGDMVKRASAYSSGKSGSSLRRTSSYAASGRSVKSGSASGGRRTGK
ncbi:MAG: hypothetical protein QF893_03990 [Alphaproteobacteria bacterium]|jgi:hypothetical protein|nr:hypothetical protein [Alphaproteobacteria bacterium]